jgi:hypothetical protein
MNSASICFNSSVGSVEGTRGVFCCSAVNTSGWVSKATSWGLLCLVVLMAHLGCLSLPAGLPEFHSHSPLPVFLGPPDGPLPFGCEVRDSPFPLQTLILVMVPADLRWGGWSGRTGRFQLRPTLSVRRKMSHLCAPWCP